VNGGMDPDTAAEAHRLHVQADAMTHPRPRENRDGSAVRRLLAWLTRKDAGKRHHGGSP